MGVDPAFVCGGATAEVGSTEAGSICRDKGGEEGRGRGRERGGIRIHMQHNPFASAVSVSTYYLVFSNWREGGGFHGRGGTDWLRSISL